MNPSAYEEIATELDGSTLTVWLARPHRLNAATPLMLDELVDAIERADADDAVRVVVLSGKGRAFCAGADLLDDRPDVDQTERESYRDGGGRATLALFRCRKPVIAAINGPAVGFGATFTLPMDARLASSDARFGFVFTRRGIVPEACSSWFLPRVVGLPRALEWVSTGRLFSAAEALDAGLVQSVHEPEQLLTAAHSLAREIAENTSAVAVAIARRMLWLMSATEDPQQAHALESKMLYDRLGSSDSAEGIDAFLEKRPARFSDRVSDGLPAELA